MNDELNQPNQSLEDLSATLNAKPSTSETSSLNPNTPVLTPKRSTRPIFVAALAGALLVAATTYVYVNTLKAPMKDSPLVEVPLEEKMYLEIFNGNETTAVNGEVLVSGKTLPHSVVMAYSDQDTISTMSDDDGFFETTVLIADGGGVVEVAAFSEDGQEAKQKLSYTTAVLGSKDEAPGQTKKVETKTAVKNDVVETSKVEKPVVVEKKTTEKVVKTEEKNPKTNKQLETKTAMSETAKEKTAKLSEPEAEKVETFLEEKAPKEKKEKLGARVLKDLTDDESSASAEIQKRKDLKFQEMKVMAATAGAELKRHALAGIVTSISPDSLTVTHQIQTEREFVIFYNENTTFVSKDSEASGSGQVAVGQRVAAVGEPIEGGLLAKRVHVIPGKAVGVMQKQPDGNEDTASDSGSLLSPTPNATVSASPSPSVGLSPTVTPVPPTPLPTLADKPSPTPEIPPEQ